MNPLTSTFRSSALLLGLALAVQTASAAFMPVYVNTTGAGPFTFNYNLNFSTLGADPGVAPRLDTGAFVTIYDVAGLISATAAPNFSVSTQFVGTTAPLTVPNDDPSALNITFTYLGAAPITVDTVFSGFSIVSNFGFTASDNYTSIFTNVSNSTTSSEVGTVFVPSAVPTGGPGPNVPDGGSTLMLLGSALFGLAMLRGKLNS